MPRRRFTGVGGMGLSMRAAFESCIGEGVEYLSQFEAGDEPLIASSAGEMLQAAKGEGRRFLESLLSGTAGGADASFDCLVATGLTNDTTMLVPAEICLRRGPGRSRMTPPFLLSTGCAAGRSKADAVLHGLCELVERDAAGLWWRGGMRGRPLALDDPASGEAAALLAELRRGNASRRTWLLDITTDLGIPAIAAVSCRADGKGFACGLGARPTLAGAARGAIMELCQNELAHAVVAAKRARGRAGRSSMPAIATTSPAPRKSMPTRARSCIRWACRLGAKRVQATGRRSTDRLAGDAACGSGHRHVRRST